MRQGASLLALIVALAACSSTPYGNDASDLVIRYAQLVPLTAGDADVDELDGATVAGVISLYLRDKPRITGISFHIDDPELSGTPAHVDDDAPFTMDLDTTSLSEGAHLLTVATHTSRGREHVVTQAFVVDNGANGPADVDAPEGATETEDAPEGATEEGAAAGEPADADAADDSGDVDAPAGGSTDSDTPSGTEEDAPSDTEGDVPSDAGDEDAAPSGSDDPAAPGDADAADGSGDANVPDDAVEEDAPVVGSDGQVLTWAPPELRDALTIQVRQSSSFVVLNLDDDRDYRLVMPSEPLRAGLKINGGRNVVMIGGEISIPWQGEGASITSRTGLKIQDVQGTVHVEGLLIHGDDLSEGIQISAPDAIVQIQNVGIFNVHARDQIGFSDNHPDIVQTYGNVRALRIDRLTGTTDYQGLFLKSDFNGPHGPITLKRINVIGESTARYLFWIRPEEGHGEVTLEDVWLDVPEERGGGLGKSVWPDVNAAEPYRAVTDEIGGDTVAWWPDATVPVVSGEVREGRPSDGDYVQLHDVGLAYASPGYTDNALVMAGR